MQIMAILEVSSVPLGRAASHLRSALCDASRLKNGWYKTAKNMRAFRYATEIPALQHGIIASQALPCIVPILLSE